MRALVLVWLIGCASTRPCPTVIRPVDARPFVWEVSGGGAQVVLFGTHHAAAGADVPAEALRAFDAAEVFVAEAAEGGKDDTVDSATGWREALELPRGHSLMRMMSADDFAELRQRLGMSAGTLSRMRPWVALMLLVRTVFEFPSPNMSQALYERAEARRIEMAFLDTWELQKVFLDLTVGVDDLRGALSHPDLRCSVEVGVARYRAGDERGFLTAGTAATAGPPALADSEASAITERSRVWTERIVDYASGGKRVFIAIGVSNIVGARGIAARLTEAGFTVTRL